MVQAAAKLRELPLNPWPVKELLVVKPQVIFNTGSSLLIACPFQRGRRGGPQHTLTPPVGWCVMGTTTPGEVLA